jgi:acyl-CoA thioester hydrolase
MHRIRIQLPASFSFSTLLAIRITDLNYGGHVGNDTILSLIQEARVQFLSQMGYTELKLDNVSLIMSDAALEFKSELFYGDVITAFVAAADFSRVGFSFYYKLTNGKEQVVALAKTGMVCFDYETRKVVSLPDAVRVKLEGHHG